MSRHTKWSKLWTALFDLWSAVAPLWPPEPRKPRGGRPRCDSRAVLAGILFFLQSGIPWEMLPRELLPRELGCSGLTCWRRWRDWQEAGIRAGLHRVLLERLSEAGPLDWSRASLPSEAVAAKRGAAETGPSPTDRGPDRAVQAPPCDRPTEHPARRAPEPGQPPRQRHAGRDPGRRARRATLDAVRPRRRPGTLHGDAAYDPRRGQAECPSVCRARSIRPRIARRGVETGEKPGQPRGGVEKPFAGLRRFRRLAIRLTNDAPTSTTPSSTKPS